MTTEIKLKKKKKLFTKLTSLILCDEIRDSFHFLSLFIWLLLFQLFFFFFVDLFQVFLIVNIHKYLGYHVRGTKFLPPFRATNFQYSICEIHKLGCLLLTKFSPYTSGIDSLVHIFG